jgi:DNA polymerase III epsilon subunit-like protein
MKRILFDFETTGLDVQNDKITQFCFFNIDTKEIYSNYVNPEKVISYEATDITGITNIDTTNYPTFKEQYVEIKRFIGKDAYLIGHNIHNFDKNIFGFELQRIRKNIPVGWKFIDTLFLARYYLPELKSHKQDILREYYNILNNNAHLANKDVLDLDIILERMMGDTKIEELYNISEDGRNKMPFGIYKGKFIKDICLEDIDKYYQLSEEKNFDLYNNILRIHKSKN